ncbi:oligosaccharide biosynthesis protein Alg14 [Thiothrix subterranea]|uniref:Oligosaccharide biosynthesis protein Alg14 n=1 Tax=Thiothrix subterranea TaxID=2735563 RepID=A0AA51MK31_9GAMM|nr:oligosaccharide biosynthesis protein Alg14 [Thiothrix subterranea]MDQ5770682.1 oligosaccharide biosynthesis protein Alg14 [Thiothrix subterranea]QQZ27552.1 oligosaccharide biosynthesis protein Alg14 [Thiothrix subterranea]WML85954.1 oligosaccharide biosynthesis protein Alg14 [Thiothrix subterranea]
MSVKPTLLAISSPGGHWIQLNRLSVGLEERYRVVYAMPAGLFTSTSLGEREPTRKVYSVVDVSADDKWRLIPCALQVLYILLKERPKAILSTGAAPGAVAIWLGSFLGIRTIWVDSIANVKQISRAGKLAQKRADVFLTQWEQLSDGQAIQYKGAVL